MKEDARSKTEKTDHPRKEKYDQKTSNDIADWKWEKESKMNRNDSLDQIRCSVCDHYESLHFITDAYCLRSGRGGKR